MPKIQDLPELTTPADGDLLPIVDVSESNQVKKIRKDNIIASVPTGSILIWGTASAPTGYVLCDGASLLRADYSVLFALIGTTYGSADGTHFNVPNLKGKVAVGFDSGETEFDNLGETGGEKTHTLTTDEMPAHIHAGAFGGNYNDPSGGGGTQLGRDSNIDTTSAGGGAAHNNLQPYIVLNYIIKF